MILSLEHIHALNCNKNEIMVLNHNQPYNIFFLGSCRIYAFLNYFLNHEHFGTNYNYVCVLVYVENMRDFSKTCIHDENFKKVLRDSKILVSEYLKHYDYFNSSPSSERNLFQMETRFEHTIFLPNYCDLQVNAKNMVKYDDEIKSMFQRLLRNEETLEAFSAMLQGHQQNELNRYYKVIAKSFMPELKHFIQENVLRRRIAHTINHPTNFLLLEMFRLLLLNVFGFSLPPIIVELSNRYEFLPSEGYADHLTWYDLVCLNYTWTEPVFDKEESDRYLLSSELFYKTNV